MKIVFSSDLDFRGSGYFNIATPLCSGLVAAGHEVKVVGLGYRGQEHHYPFSIIPCRDFREQGVAIQNLCNLWQPDLIIVSLDIPMQEGLLSYLRDQCKITVPYIGIFPLESEPLCMSWAMVLMKMQGQLCISDFGAKECNKMEVPATYIPVGIDTDFWYPGTEKDRKLSRASMGVDDDDFVILTIADNQERKNLPASFEAVALFKKQHPELKVKYWLVTREHNQIGYKLRDLSRYYGIHKELTIIERGIPMEQVRSMYHGADCFLLLSKAEGCGMPILESMACKIPVVATSVSAIRDHLSHGRGYLVNPRGVFIDSFGNEYRYLADPEDAAECIGRIHYTKDMLPFKSSLTEDALSYVKYFTWDKSVKVLLDKISEVVK